MQSEEFGLFFPIGETAAITQIVYIRKVTINRDKVAYLKIMIAFPR
jgi:hypothetical protein